MIVFGIFCGPRDDARRALAALPAHAVADLLEELGIEVGDDRLVAAAEALRQSTASASDRAALRADFIRELRARHFGHLRSARSASDAIARLVARYEAGRWRRDRDRLTVPPELVGTPEALAWRLLRDAPPMVGVEQIRKLLR